MLAVWIVFAITIFTIIAYAQEAIKIEVTAITAMTTLIVLFYVFGYNNSKLIAAFSSPALITVVCMLIISQAIINSNSFNIINKVILHQKNKYPTLTITTLLLTAFTCSLCINNTPIVAIFIPLINTAAKKFNIATSKVMIPLAFTTSIGGLVTVIASGTNLLIYGKLAELGYNISIFDFILPGSIIATVSLIYTTLILPKILPSIKPISTQLLTDKFVVKVTIPQESQFIGKNVFDIPIENVIALQRHNNYSYRIQNKVLKEGDIIFLNATKDELSYLLNNQAGLIIKNSEYTNNTGKIKEDLILREVVVPPHSYMVGKRLENIEYYTSSKVFALGIQRSSSLLSNNIHTTTLKGGDKILLVGEKESLKTFTANHQLISTNHNTLHIPKHTKAPLVNIIFGGVVFLTIFKILPIMVSSIIGVTTLLITKCIRINNIKESFDIKLFLIITSAYMISTAIQETGGLLYIVDIIKNISHEMPVLITMSIIFISITMLNEVMSNNAVGLIFTPIVIAIASTTNVDPKLFIWALFFASNCAFATPISYQTNLLVMGPGNYQFKDYYKIGIPLTILIYMSYLVFSYFYFIKY